MKERAILFSGRMVRAILEGRKTQTRRLVKPQPIIDGPVSWWPDNSKPEHAFIGDGDLQIKLLEDASCPYGYAYADGSKDRLWVRETWAALDREFEDPEVIYRADYRPGTGIYASPCNCGWCDDGENHAKWRPSIYMPRWASRINLEITGVRVERLQDITTSDIAAEGVDNGKSNAKMGDRHDAMQRIAFEELWDSINGDRAAWSSNPWVWVVDFARVQP